MRKILIILTLGVILAIGSFSLFRKVSAQTPSPTPSPLVDASGSAGEINVISPDALTSFTVSNPYCYQPDPAVDVCSINFRFVQASDNQTSAPFMTWLAFTISGKKRFNATAFFEGTITYSYNMVPDGLKVPCGAPNAGGAGTQFGNVYGVTIQPLDSSRNPMSTDIANVTCPAFAP
jgi:hypothetical protein